MKNRYIKTIAILLYLLITTTIFSQEINPFWGGSTGENLYKIDNKYLYVGYRYGNYTYYNADDLKINKYGYYTWDTKGKANFTLRKQIVIPGEKFSYNFKFKDYSNSRYGKYVKHFYDSNLKKITASSSSLMEIINDKQISYDTTNLFKIFFHSGVLEDLLGLWNFSNLPWVEGEKGSGEESFIEIEFKDPIKNLSILNGYVDVNRMNLFYENNRVAEMEIIDLQNNKIYQLNFDDYVYFNNINFPVSTNHVKLIIKKVYKGTKYNDTCISGMRYDIKDYKIDHKEWIEDALKRFDRN